LLEVRRAWDVEAVEEWPDVEYRRPLDLAARECCGLVRGIASEHFGVQPERRHSDEQLVAP
jgi:hypothetical protein